VSHVRHFLGMRRRGHGKLIWHSSLRHGVTECSTILHRVEEILSERRRPRVEAGRVLHGQGCLAVEGGDWRLCLIIESGTCFTGADKRRCCRCSEHLLRCIIFSIPSGCGKEGLIIPRCLTEAQRLRQRKQLVSVISHTRWTRCRHAHVVDCARQRTG
jgi:hypothetical protein